MVAGVAHEINTPLGYARSNAEIVRKSLTDISELCSSQSKALSLLTSEHATDEEVAQALTDATVRNENLRPDELTSDLSHLLEDADYGLVQIAELVASLKDFSRVDRSRHDLFNVHDGLESALKIAHNVIKHRVEVVKHFGNIPTIQCSPSQLNQVFLNLITNAAQAIEGQGKIFIHTNPEPDGISIRIMDTGSGMSEETLKKIFEPFFTTKPVGKGTGLGLTIVFRIIQDHGGRIEVKSKPGKGSEFIIHLPLKQKRQQAEAVEAEAAIQAA
jgi:signal transduction histidine kinase